MPFVDEENIPSACAGGTESLLQSWVLSARLLFWRVIVAGKV